MAVAAVAMLVASVAFAGWTTINLTSGGIDTTWGTANYSEPTNDAGITDRDDIKNAWVRYDGSNIYFRIETWAGPVLSSNNYRAAGAIDCNHDGDFNDPIVNGPDGDRLIVYAPDNSVTIYDGALNVVGPVSGDWSDPIRASVTTNIEWGAPLYLLYPDCRGSVSPVNIGWSTGTGLGTVIDQSSTLVELSNPMDFGDTVQTLPPPPATCAAPDTATGLQCNGARHGILPYQTPSEPLRLGPEPVDADPGSLQSANSDADDTNGTTPNDERGIAPDPAIAWSVGAPPNAGGKLLFSVHGGAARLVCFIDWNNDKQWSATNEAVINANVVATSGSNRTFTIPANATIANSSLHARCRVYPQPPATGAGTPTPTPAARGAYEFGEVEDHIWSFDANGFYIAPSAPTAATGLAIATIATNDVKLTWTNPAPNDSARILGHATNPYFTSADSPFFLDQTDSASPWEYLHTGLRGAPAQTVYYIVYGRLGATPAASPSNRVGLFEFGLVQGTP
jgi:hypothetical protein